MKLQLRATRTWRYLASRFPAATYHDTLERAAAEYRAASGVSDSVPVDVERIATAHSIHLTNKPRGAGGAEGTLRPGVGGFQCQLLTGVSPLRRRFSIAHEIGHSIFYNSDNGPLPQHRIGVLDHDEAIAEEKICNDFASALLLPSSELCDFARKPVASTSPAGFLCWLEAMALRCRVSVPALVVRLGEIGIRGNPYCVLVLSLESRPPDDPSLRLRVTAWADLARSPGVVVWGNRSPTGLNLLSVERLLAQWRAAREASLADPTVGVRGWKFPTPEPFDADECINVSLRDQQGKWVDGTQRMHASSFLYARADCGDGNVYILSALSPASPGFRTNSPVARKVPPDLNV